MTGRQQQLTDIVQTLASIVRNIQLRLALHDVCPEPHLNFWRLIYGDLTDFAVLECCKLFASDDEQHQTTHWKNVVSDREQFGGDLLANLKLSMEEFFDYWQEMKRHRDMPVAHHDPGRSNILNFPNFNLSLESAYFYYDYANGELQALGFQENPKDIRQYATDFANQSKEIAAAAMEATKSISEKVY
jgi:hypothetical protein